MTPMNVKRCCLFWSGPRIIQNLSGDIMNNPFFLLFALFIGHALADFPLQGDFIARGKNRHNAPTNVPIGQKPVNVWVHCLTAHALIHAGFVWAITGCVWLGVIEMVLHWMIDFAKCENWTNPHTDQLLHIACKVGYVLVLAGF